MGPSIDLGEWNMVTLIGQDGMVLTYGVRDIGVRVMVWSSLEIVDKYNLVIRGLGERGS